MHTLQIPYRRLQAAPDPVLTYSQLQNATLPPVKDR